MMSRPHNQEWTPQRGVGDAVLPAWCWVGFLVAIEGIVTWPLVAGLVSQGAGYAVLYPAVTLAIVAGLVMRHRRVRLTGPGRWLYFLSAVVGGAFVALLARHRDVTGAVAMWVVTVLLVAAGVAWLWWDHGRTRG